MNEGNHSLRSVLRHPVTYAVASGTCIAIDSLLDYVGGRAGFPLAIGFLPAGLLPWCGAIICGVGMVGFAVWFLIRKRRIGPVVLAFAILIAFWALPRMILPTKPFLMGFHHQVYSRTTVNDLRAVAVMARSSGDFFLPGPGKWSLWEPAKHAAKWEELKKVPSFGRLDTSVVITAHDGIVQMNWGGALVGHWGIRIHRSLAAHRQTTPIGLLSQTLLYS